MKLDVSITAGILDWVDVGVSIPTINNLDVDGTSLGRTQTELGGYGLGDIRLAMRSRLHPEKALGQFGLAAMVLAHLPTGDPTASRRGETTVQLASKSRRNSPESGKLSWIEPRIIAM